MPAVFTVFAELTSTKDLTETADVSFHFSSRAPFKRVHCWLFHCRVAHVLTRGDIHASDVAQRIGILHVTFEILTKSELGSTEAVSVSWVYVMPSSVITAAEEVMFSSFVCLFVCLSVCLLATLCKNFQTDLHEIFREGWQWASKQMIKFWWRSGSQSGYRDCFPDSSLLGDMESG